MTRAAMVSMFAVLLLGAAPALAQESAADPGEAAADTARDAVEAPDATAGDPVAEAPTVEEGAILPSADDHEASRAPSMELDCVADPDACVEPLDGPSEGPEMASPDDPATAADESEAAEPVIANP